MGQDEFAAIKIAIQASLKDFSSQMGEFEKILKGQEQQTQKTKSSWLDLFSSFSAAQIATDALYKLKNVAMDGIKEYDKFMVSQKRLELIFGEGAKTLVEYAKRQQESTRYSKEQTIAAIEVLGNLRMSQENIEKLMPVIMDFGAKTGDVTGAARAFGYAIEYGTSRGLRPYGITLKEGLSSQEIFNYLLKQGEGNVKGLADELGRAGTGPLTIVKNMISDMADDIGKALNPSLIVLADTAKTYLIPVLEKCVSIFGKLMLGVEWIGIVIKRGIVNREDTSFVESMRQASKIIDDRIEKSLAPSTVVPVNKDLETKPLGKGGKKGDTVADAAVIRAKEALDTYKAWVQQASDTLKGEFESNAISINEYYDKQILILELTAKKEKELLEVKMAAAQEKKDENELLSLGAQYQRIDINLKTELNKTDRERRDTIKKNNEEMQRALVILKQAQDEQNADQYNSKSPMAQMKRQQDKEMEGLLTHLDKLMGLRGKDGVDRVKLEETIAGQINLINRKSINYSKELAFEEAQYKIGLAAQTGDQLVTLFDNISQLQGSKGKTMWNASKHAQAVMAVIHGVQGYMKTIAEFGLPLGALLGLPALGIGITQAAIIESKQYPEKAASGGLLKGRRHSQGGIMIEAEDDEYIMKRNAVKYYGSSFMHMLNNMELSRSMLPRFEAGGQVSSSQRGGNLSIANFIDKNLFDAYIGSEDGKNSIINVIAKNSFSVRRAIGVKSI